MNILEIYKKYQNTPQLIEHQLRVAAVADLLVSGVPNPLSLNLDREAVIKACLFHDIGNIIKFDFTKTAQLYPDAYSQQKLEYWQSVKDKFVAKYGRDEHYASLVIAKEEGVEEYAVRLADYIGFNTGKDNAESPDYNRKICAYSDMRVGPNGVISLEERFADLRVRYDAKRIHHIGSSERQRQEFEDGLRRIEQQIFRHCNIKPQDITEQAIAPLVEKLRNWEI